METGWAATSERLMHPAYRDPGEALPEETEKRPDGDTTAANAAGMHDCYPGGNENNLTHWPPRD